MLTEFTKVGVDVSKLAADLQEEGAKSFDASWQDLLNAIDAKTESFETA